MVLVDTSAWVEYLRDTGSPACNRVGKLLDTDLATCDAVRMELLAGARDEQHGRDLRRLIARAALVPMMSAIIGVTGSAKQIPGDVDARLQDLAVRPKLGRAALATNAGRPL